MKYLSIFNSEEEYNTNIISEEVRDNYPSPNVSYTTNEGKVYFEPKSSDCNGAQFLPCMDTTNFRKKLTNGGCKYYPEIVEMCEKISEFYGVTPTAEEHTCAAKTLFMYKQNNEVFFDGYDYCGHPFFNSVCISNEPLYKNYVSQITIDGVKMIDMDEIFLSINFDNYQNIKDISMGGSYGNSGILCLDKDGYVISSNLPCIDTTDFRTDLICGDCSGSSYSEVVEMCKSIIKKLTSRYSFNSGSVIGIAEGFLFIVSDGENYEHNINYEPLYKNYISKITINGNNIYNMGIFLNDKIEIDEISFDSDDYVMDKDGYFYHNLPCIDTTDLPTNFVVGEYYPEVLEVFKSIAEFHNITPTTEEVTDSPSILIDVRNGTLEIYRQGGTESYNISYETLYTTYIRNLSNYDISIEFNSLQEIIRVNIDSYLFNKDGLCINNAPA